MPWPLLKIWLGATSTIQDSMQKNTEEVTPLLSSLVLSQIGDHVRKISESNCYIKTIKDELWIDITAYIQKPTTRPARTKRNIHLTSSSLKFDCFRYSICLRVDGRLVELSNQHYREPFNYWVLGKRDLPQSSYFSVSAHVATRTFCSFSFLILLML